MARIIPVLDVMNGVVVRAVGGRRREYQPIRSVLTSSVDPHEVAIALQQASGSQELYVADLDAIQRRGGVSSAVQQLCESWPGTILLDAGGRLHHAPHVRSVLGSEMLRPGQRFPGPTQAGTIISLDLRQGRLIHDPTVPPVAFLEAGLESGHATVIVLDLAAVGERNGPCTWELCTEIKRKFPKIELIAGGGIRNAMDVKRYDESGVDAVLMASALHAGTWP